MTSCTKSCVKNCSRISFSRRCNFTAACFMVSLSRIHEKPYFRSRTNFQEFTNPKGLGYLHFNPLSWKSLIAHHVVAYRSNAGPSECKHQDHRFDHSGHLSLSAHCLPCFFVFRFGIRGNKWRKLIFIVWWCKQHLFHVQLEHGTFYDDTDARSYDDTDVRRNILWWHWCPVMHLPNMQAICIWYIPIHSHTDIKHTIPTLT